mmetsp:Transcript_24072/g.75020  ORF Transcript_24072/g.75020 Transcript_24072/m.75020 type:complete len:256 (-) Transcript_24072:1399-2166(-)
MAFHLPLWMSRCARPRPLRTPQRRCWLRTRARPNAKGVSGAPSATRPWWRSSRSGGHSCRSWGAGARPSASCARSWPRASRPPCARTCGCVWWVTGWASQRVTTASSPPRTPPPSPPRTPPPSPPRLSPRGLRRHRRLRRQARRRQARTARQGRLWGLPENAGVPQRAQLLAADHLPRGAGQRHLAQRRPALPLPPPVPRHRGAPAVRATSSAPWPWTSSARCPTYMPSWRRVSGPRYCARPCDCSQGLAHTYRG